jgi:choline dehydrogenase-like flavoprotein
MLTSNDPFAPPSIDPGLMSTEYDMFVMQAAVRTAQRFLSAPAWQGYVTTPVGALANVTTDAALESYIRSGAATTWHIVGTAAMSAHNASYGVVNPDLRVKGVTGLRIVDLSVLVRYLRLDYDYFILRRPFFPAICAERTSSDGWIHRC